MAWYPARLCMLGVKLMTVLVISSALACVSDTASEGISGTQFDYVWKYSKLPPPAQYGNILISRLTHSSTQPPVAFSHWAHRRFYTCRVCHFELNFAMKTNASDITEAMIRKGDYCGACHNGKIAFGINDSTCGKCHTGRINSSDDRFSLLKDFPKARYGDEINWVKVLKKGLITPKQSLFNPDYEPIPFEKILRLEPERGMTKTRAIFPHQKHIDWLDCADCHPAIFDIQMKGAQRFRMDSINRGMFCGVCHLTVAFPVQDCRRCHPDLN